MIRLKNIFEISFRSAFEVIDLDSIHGVVDTELDVERSDSDNGVQMCWKVSAL